MVTARRALAFSYLDRYASTLVFFVTSIVIARLLTPAEVGIYSIAVILIGFVSPFRDLGASQYLIYEKDLTTERIKSVWAIQIGLGLLLALLIYSLRNIVADFYAEPEIAEIMAVVAASSLLIPFGALTSAWLTRELRFDRLGIIRFSGTCTGSIASIYFAWLGHGPISLAYGALANNMVNALIASIYRPKHFPWLPGLHEIKRVIGFGSSISGITLINMAYHGVAELIVGRTQGMHAAGLLGRANQLAGLFETLVMTSVHSIALPTFSKMKNEQQDMEPTFIKGISLISAIGWSSLGYLAIMAFPVIDLLYGDQWHGAVDLARILCISMAFLILTSLCPAILIALNQKLVVISLMLFNFILQATLVLVVANHGLLEVSFAILVSSILITGTWLKVFNVVLRFSWSSFFKEIRKSLFVTICALISPLLVVIFYGVRPVEVYFSLSLSAVGAVAGFVLAIYLSKHPIWHEIDLILAKN